MANNYYFLIANTNDSLFMYAPGRVSHKLHLTFRIKA